MVINYLSQERISKDREALPSLDNRSSDSHLNLDYSSCMHPTGFYNNCNSSGCHVHMEHNHSYSSPDTESERGTSGFQIER